MAVKILPLALKNALQQTLSASLDKAEKMGVELSQAYRVDEVHPLNTEASLLSYLATRLPGTLSAFSSALDQLKGDLGEIHSLLELGAGPGVAYWEALERLPNLSKVTLFEQNSGLIRLGKHLGATSSIVPDWIQGNLLSPSSPYPNRDLVVLSYVLGELPDTQYLKVVQKAYDATNKYLIILEPGSKKGFERIRTIRSHIIDQGGQILAPCPNSLTCPIQGDDWCHFSVRHERLPQHWAVRSGGVREGDEKFSYLIVSPSLQAKDSAPRLIKAPMVRPGHVTLDLCMDGQVKRETISKKHGDLFKKAKKVSWGESWE